MPKISVIVPNYNHAPFLKERMETILEQDYSDREIILLDDASTDDSLAVLETYRHHPQVKVLEVNIANTGNTFLQWQRGLQYAAGDYVWIAESDDVASPTLLSRLVETLESQQAVMAFAQSQMIDEEGRVLPRRIYSPFTHSFGMEGKAFIVRYLLGENMVCNASAVLFRRSALRTVDMAQIPQYNASGDRLFWIQLALQGRVAFVAEPLNRFRQHTQKVSIAAAEQGLNCVQDHQIYAQVRSMLPMMRYQQRLICGYHWHAMHLPWVTQQGLERAMKEWAQEPYFGWLAWWVYKCYRIAIRMKKTCFI